MRKLDSVQPRWRVSQSVGCRACCRHIYLSPMGSRLGNASNCIENLLTAEWNYEQSTRLQRSVVLNRDVADARSALPAPATAGARFLFTVSDDSREWSERGLRKSLSW